MNYLWRIIRPLMAITGALLVFIGAGTSDYHIIELGTSEPSHVTPMIVIGILMFIPTLIHVIIQDRRENA